MREKHTGSRTCGASQVPADREAGAPWGDAQAGTALAVTLGVQRTARPALWGRGAMAPGLAALTTSTVPPIKTNSFVMISTISRTCEGSAESGLLTRPAAETPAPKRRLHPRDAARRRRPHLAGVGAGVDAQEARVLVAVVVGSCVVHPVVPVGTQRKGHRSVPSWCDAPSAGRWPWTACHTPVEHVEVEPGEHALARPAG